jgi:cytochrome P450
VTATAIVFRPPAPQPHEKPLGLLGRIATLRRNPIEIWTRAHYERPVMVGKTVFGNRAVVSDPAGVRRIFLDNVANYRKDDLQLRVLRPGLGNGLLTADGEEWRAQRRSLAPLFTPRQVADFTEAMAEASRGGVERLRRCDDRRIDMSGEMARLTLEILEHTLFSSGLGRNAGEFQQAVTRYFDTIGRVGLLDLIGLPKFLSRLRRRKGRSTVEWFGRVVEDIVGARRKLIAGGGSAPRDLLTLLLEAQDPATGQGMPEGDLRANIVTFIGAGHETTANALTWTFYLLSQSPDWRARVEAETDTQLHAGPMDTLAERMPVAKAVLEEALRLYPPAGILTRTAIAVDEIGGKRIVAGTLVTVSPFLLHRHRTLWEFPDNFDPNRFLGANRDRIDRFAYIPSARGRASVSAWGLRCRKR